MGVLPFARAGVEHARASRKRRGEGAHGVLDFAFEVQNVPPQRPRQAIRDAGVFHWRLRLNHDGRSAARRGFGQREGQSRGSEREIREVLGEAHGAALGDAPHAARHGVEPRREAAGEARGIVAQRKILAPQHAESAHGKQLFQIARAVIEKMARHVDAVPRAAQQAELP